MLRIFYKLKTKFTVCELFIECIHVFCCALICCFVVGSSLWMFDFYFYYVYVVCVHIVTMIGDKCMHVWIL